MIFFTLRKQSLAFLLITCFSSFYSHATQEQNNISQLDNVRVAKSYGNARVAKLISVYDGDTFKIDIAGFPPIIGEGILVRVYGIDTPEIKSKNPKEKALAIKARDFMIARLSNAKVVELRDMRRDKYFRLLADVFVDGSDVGDELIEAKLARPYFGDAKESWDDAAADDRAIGVAVTYQTIPESLL